MDANGLARDSDEAAYRFLVHEITETWEKRVVSPSRFPGASWRVSTTATCLAIMSEPAWATYSLSIGGLRLFALYVNGSWRRRPGIRIAGAVLGMIGWIVLGGLYWLAVTGGARLLPGVHLL